MLTPTRKARLPAVVLAISALLFPGVAAAWKPTSHVYFAEIAVHDALDDGYVEIPILGTGQVRRYKSMNRRSKPCGPAGLNIARACWGPTLTRIY